MKNPLYRARNGWVFGVCQGISNYFDLSAIWLRILFVAGFVFSGFFPFVILYIVLALIIKQEPVLSPLNKSEEEFYQSYTSSGSLSLRRLKETYDSLDKRIRRMENSVTSKAYDWERRFNSE